jgi:ribokinase
MAKFFVVGDATVDQMYFIDALPEPGGEVTALRALMEPGGAGGTMASVLGRLGHDVRIATRVGTGPFSELALRNVRAAGVDTSLIQIDERHQTSSVTILITPDAQRTMISAVGASRYLDSARLEPSHVKERDALVMSAYSLVGGPQREYAVQALAYAAEAGATTFVDMGSGAVNALQGRLMPLLRGVDYVLMNEKELFTLTGESSISDAVSGLRAQGIDQVVVKVGEMGSIVVTPNLTELVDSLEIDDVVDSTGAGDYYTATFAHAVLDGYDLLEAAWRGNVAGALNTTRVGAQRAVIDLQSLERHAAGADLTAAPSAR